MKDPSQVIREWADSVVLPFGLNDLFGTMSGFFVLLGPVLLLGLSLQYVPLIIKAIYYAIDFDRKYHREDSLSERLRVGAESIKFRIKYRHEWD